MRPEDVLPDAVNHVTIDGQPLRKGTVAAFLANARIWLDADAGTAQHDRAEADIVALLPALRALGLFDVLDVRDATLRRWLASQ